jgi:LEA14-like dessication related protein
MRRSSSYAIIILVSMLISGCALLQEIRKPEIVSVRPKIAGIDFEGINMAFDIDVNNPYPLPIRTPRFRYGIAIQGNEFFKGEAESGINLPAVQVGTLTLPVQLSYKNLWQQFQGLSHAREVDYTLSGALLFSALGSSFELPLSHNGTFPVLRPPTFSNIRVNVPEVSLTGAKISVDADVKNPNVFDLGIQNLGYVLKIGGEEIGGLTASSAGTVGAGESSRLSLAGEISAASSLLRLIRGGRLGEAMLVPSGAIQTPYGIVTLK